MCAGIRGGVSPNQTITTQLCSDSLIWSQLVIQRFLMRKSHFSKHMDFFSFETRVIGFIAKIKYNNFVSDLIWPNVMGRLQNKLCTMSPCVSI